MAILGCTDLYWNHFRETFSTEPDYGNIYTSTDSLGEEPAPFKAQREVDVNDKSKEKHHRERPGKGIVLLWEAKHIISHYKSASKKVGDYTIFLNNEKDAVELGKFLRKSTHSWTGNAQFGFVIEDTNGTILYKISNEGSCSFFQNLFLIIHQNIGLILVQ